MRPLHGLPAEPPSTLAPGIATIVRLVNQQATAWPTGESRARAASSLHERPSVVGILGPHGSGKSTMLRYACGALEQDPKRLTLPIVRPEHFAAGDQLFGWTLAGIQQWLSLDKPSIGEREVAVGHRSLTIHQLVELLRRQEALARSEFKEGQPAGALSADEWAMGLTAVTTAGLQLGNGWNALLDALSDEAHNERIDQLVIAIDDADQAPHLLPDLLRDLRWLTSHALVSAIICADDVSLVAILAAEQPERLPASLRDRQASAAAFKVLPRHLRLAVPRLSVNDRLGFTPFGEEGTLLDVLARFPIAREPQSQLHTLADYFLFRIGDRSVPSQYTPILAELPREMEQLWYGLRDLAEGAAEHGPSQTAQAIRLLATRALEATLAERPDIPSDVATFDDDDGVASVTVDVSALAFGVQAGRGLNIWRSGESTVGVRRINEFFATVDQTDDSGSDDDTAATEAMMEGLSLGGRRVPLPLVESLRFLIDMGDPDNLSEPPLALSGIIGSKPFAVGENFTGTLVCDVGSEHTDNRFLLIPSWDSYYDVALYTRAWNQMMYSLLQLGADAGDAVASSGEPDRFVKWLLCLHIALVCDVQANRSISTGLLPQSAGEIVAFVEQWDDATVLGELEQRLKELYMRPESPMQRSHTFENWLDAYLPRAADALICPAAFADELLAMRGNVLDGAGVRAEADRRCAAVLARRISRSLTAPWIASRIELLARFEPSQAAALHTASQVAKARVGESQPVISDALAKRGASPALIAHVLLSGIDEGVAHELRQLGIPPDTVEVLARSFPPGAEAEAAHGQTALEPE